MTAKKALPPTRPPQRTKADARSRAKTAKRNPGLPDPASVVATTSFVSPKGRRYVILKTTETDAYDESPGGKRRR